MPLDLTCELSELVALQNVHIDTPCTLHTSTSLNSMAIMHSAVILHIIPEFQAVHYG